MITLPTALILTAAVLSTSFISGIFGMAGGLILMGILLAIMPLPAAMMLHGATQMASNGWRAWLWRSHIQWRIVGHYAVGSIVTALALAAVRFVPSTALALIMLGLLPFVGLLLPERLAPDITRRGQAFAIAAVCTTLMLLAGVAGPFLDTCFVRSGLDRKQLVATKAATQLLGHLLKVAYFGQVAALAGAEVAPAALILAVVLAPLGTQLARRVLEAISDTQFRRWSRGLIAVIATVYLIQGLRLL